MDGISDDKAQFHVEYVKEPVNIDEAVFEVVNFNDTGNKTRDMKRHVRRMGSDETCSETNVEDIKTRSPRKRRKGRRKSKPGNVRQVRTVGR